ncbi:hypothetical protein [Paraburkholderia mimosarum]|uniref:hypothetical protein n=1 Tax=Paraburkholderia mimosarum TaxID=312026 RepID=UPI0004018DB8|nr:hypothetical protein [Paraburkholderia mimosarum]
MIDLATRRRGLARGIVTELQYDSRVLSQQTQFDSERPAGLCGRHPADVRRDLEAGTLDYAAA